MLRHELDVLGDKVEFAAIFLQQRHCELKLPALEQHARFQQARLRHLQMNIRLRLGVERGCEMHVFGNALDRIKRIPRHTGLGSGNASGQQDKDKGNRQRGEREAPVLEGLVDSPQVRRALKKERRMPQLFGPGNRPPGRLF